MTPNAELRVERRLQSPPFFSICIPQHNRTSFLLEACRSLATQAHRDFEVCISDDQSSDGRDDEVVQFLDVSGLAFAYCRQSENRRYDANLRSAIDLAAGRYCFLLGNDDAVKDRRTLARLHDAIRAMEEPAVVLTNFEDYSNGRVTHRVRRTRVRGTGPRVAAGCFRKFSFLSGVVLETSRARAAATATWDGSEMYQMYIGTRIIAAGGVLGETDLVAVRKDIQILEEVVDSYACKNMRPPRGISGQWIPLVTNARLVIAALRPHLPARHVGIVCGVLVQYFGFLYPFWLLEYRRVQSWRFAAGVSRAMRPRHTLAGAGVSTLERLCAAAVYGISTVIGLFVPLLLFRGLHGTARFVAGRIADWSMEWETGERAN